MGTFIEVQVPSDEDRKVELLFAGRMQARSRELISDYDLYDLQRKRYVARLKAYPRCTESAMALFLRLLLEAKSDVLGQRFQGALIVNQLVGPQIRKSLACEVLLAQQVDAEVAVTLLSPEALVAGHLISLEAEATARAVVRASLVAALGWRSTPGPLYPPLSAVPIRRGIGFTPSVRLNELPPLTAHRVRRYFHLSPDEETLDAERWQLFASRLVR